MSEEFKPVNGFGDRYLISSDGRLFRKESVDSSGRKMKSLFLKSYVSKPLGYHVFSISINGKNVSLYAHRLIAEAFIEKIEGKNYVNHKDGNKKNNEISNLEWVTHKENMHHAIKIGLANPFKNNGAGDKCASSKLTEKKVREIKGLILSGMHLAKIAKMFEVSAGTIGFIKSGKTWSCVI